MNRIKRSERLEVRIAPGSLEIIRHAAGLQGRSVSDFVISASQSLAGQVIQEFHITHLSIENQKAFAAGFPKIIDAPHQESAAAAGSKGL